MERSSRTQESMNEVFVDYQPLIVRVLGLIPIESITGFGSAPPTSSAQQLSSSERVLIDHMQERIIRFHGGTALRSACALCLPGALAVGRRLQPMPPLMGIDPRLFR